MTPDREHRYIEEIETLQEENRQLKERLGYRNRDTELSMLRAEWGLAPAEAKMLLTLYRASGRLLRKWDLMSAADASDEADTKGVDVRICKIRAKCGDPKIVLTVWGQGYQMSPEAQQKVRAVLLRDGDEDTRL